MARDVESQSDAPRRAQAHLGESSAEQSTGEPLERRSKGPRRRNRSAVSVILPPAGPTEDVSNHVAALHEAFEDVQIEVIVPIISPRDHVDRSVGSDALPSRPRKSGRPKRNTSAPNEHTVALAMWEAMQSAHAPYVLLLPPGVAVPPQQLARMYHVATVHDADFVVGSRFRPGGRDAGSFAERLVHRAQCRFARILFPERLSHVSDPLSGVLLGRRAVLEDEAPWPSGASLTLESLLSAPWRTVVESPIMVVATSHEMRASQRASRLTVSLRELVQLVVSLPSAALVWKSLLGWILAFVVASLPMVALHFSPLWVRLLDAIETMLMVVAGCSTLNRYHRPRLGKFVGAWARAHVRYALPLMAQFAVSWVFASPLHSSIASYALGCLACLAMQVITNTKEDPRRVLFTTAAIDPSETVSVGRRDPGGQTLTTIMTAVALIAGVAVIAATQLGPIIVVPAVLIGAALVLQYRVAPAQAFTVLLAAATCVSAVDYVFWRIPMTNLAAWYVAIPLLLAELFGVAHLLGLQWSLWPRKRQRLRHEENPSRRPIFVLIPTVDEGHEILEPTVRASVEARRAYLDKYPHGRVTIALCNDGYVAGAPNWQEPERLAHELGVECITRTQGEGAKAGNIEHARRTLGATNDALIAILDADQVACEDFLLEMVKPFRDSGIGWVQSGQYYRNVDNPVARWADDQQALFYHLLCPGKESLNAAFMCGTNLMLRAAALDEIGGFPQDSITEDFAASIDLHSRWRSLYHPEPLVMGMGPLDLAGYFKQQRRWAIGTLTVLRTRWRAIFLPGRGGLTLAQRLQYALGCTHYLCGVRDFIYVVVPLVYVAFGVSAVKSGTMTTYLWHFLPYWLLSMSAFIYAAWNRTGWRGVVLGFASFPILMSAAYAVVVGRRATFTVTAKRRSGGTSLMAAAPHALAWGASVAALVWNWRTGAFTQGASFFVEVWLAYITLMLTLTLGLATHAWLYHQTESQPLIVFYRRWRGRARAIVSVRIAQRLATAAVATALVALLTMTTLGEGLREIALAPFALAPATATPMVKLRSAMPLFGITGPTETVARDSDALPRQLDMRFSVVGRTENVTEDFDIRWAERLRAAGKYPLLTLQFGHYDAAGLPSLDSSLMSVANGVHDPELTRLAQAVRTFGTPVLITILPNVDRSWSLTSAVANGGSAGDVSRAWRHVRSIFAATGARNVAWVWAPKDLVHDQEFTPPPDLIDFVMVNVTHLAGLPGDDPQIIGEASQAHPHKSLLVEVTTVGSDASEAAWLRLVTAQTRDTPDFAGFIYYDGAPSQSTPTTSTSPDTQAVRAMWSVMRASR